MRKSLLMIITRPFGNRGFSIVEMLIAIGLIGGLALGTSFVISQLQGSDQRALADFWLEVRREEIFSYLRQDQNWQKLVQDNPNMSCLSQTSPTACSTDEASLKISVDPGFVLDGYKTNLGLSADGNVCYQYSSQNERQDCPIGIDMKWKALCSGPSCPLPEAKISVRFLSPQTLSRKRDYSKYNITLVRSEKVHFRPAICEQVGGRWTGTNCDMSALLTPCGTGQYLSGFQSNGSPICLPNVSCTAPSCGVAFDTNGVPQCLPGPIDCMGSWTACSNTCGQGTQTFQVSQQRQWCGNRCLYAQGTVRACTEYTTCLPNELPPPTVIAPPLPEAAPGECSIGVGKIQYLESENIQVTMNYNNVDQVEWSCAGGMVPFRQPSGGVQNIGRYAVGDYLCQARAKDRLTGQVVSCGTANLKVEPDVDVYDGYRIGSGDLCIDHWIESLMIYNGGKLELWVWGTDPTHTRVGWNCLGYNAGFPIKIWTSPKVYYEKPTVTLSGYAHAGAGCSPGGFGSFSPYTMRTLGICPAPNRGNANFDVHIVVDKKNIYTGVQGKVPKPYNQ